MHAVIDGHTYELDTPEEVQAAVRRMAQLGLYAVSTSDGTRLTPENYRCPGCGDMRTNEDPRDAACIYCARCPQCAPSRHGLEEYCDECAAK